MSRSLALRLLGALVLGGTLSLFGAGCANVKPHQREYLTDRIMTDDRQAKEDKQEQKWLEAREGSTGGAGGAGGGCACN
jgi:hypothetical protein